MAKKPVHILKSMSTQVVSNGARYFSEVPLKNQNILHYIEFSQKQNNISFVLFGLIQYFVNFFRFKIAF